MDEQNKHMARIAAHYAHAKEKHPHFADEVLSDETQGFAADLLSDARKMIACDAESGRVMAEGLLVCELAEVFEAYAAGRRADAIEECYDAVAVLLRMAETIAAENGDAR